MGGPPGKIRINAARFEGGQEWGWRKSILVVDPNN